MAVYESQETKNGVYDRVQQLSDRVVSPDTRQQIVANVSSFANEQPFLFSFIAIQFLLSFLPIAVFASFTLGTVAFSLVTAFLFSAFWIGTAVFVLVPTLFFTTSVGIAIWAWAVGSFVIARYLYNLIPITVKGGVQVEMPNGQAMIVNKTGDGFGDVHAKIEQVHPEKQLNNVPQRQFSGPERQFNSQTLQQTSY